MMMGSGCSFELGSVAYGHDRVALMLLLDMVKVLREGYTIKVD